MRKVLVVAALILTAVASPTFAKDWGEMNVPERLAWTKTYIKQTCPKGLSTNEYSRGGEIKDAPQWGVKWWIGWHCKS